MYIVTLIAFVRLAELLHVGKFTFRVSSSTKENMKLELKVPMLGFNCDYCHILDDIIKIRSQTRQSDVLSRCTQHGGYGEFRQDGSELCATGFLTPVYHLFQKSSLRHVGRQGCWVR